jgi:hypothetical protein
MSQLNSKVCKNTSIPPSNVFSVKVNDALSHLTAKFGHDINDAYVTAPATEQRARETEADKISKIHTIEQNKMAILMDMAILDQTKTLGNYSSDLVSKLQGFEQLGGSDYLDIPDDSSDSEYDPEENDCNDSDDDSEDERLILADDKDVNSTLCNSKRNVSLDSESGEDDDDDEDTNAETSDDDDEDEDDSDYDDSEFDSDSSIDSYGELMADMEESMGLHIPAQFKLKGNSMDGSTMSLCSMAETVQSEDL